MLVSSETSLCLSSILVLIMIQYSNYIFFLSCRGRGVWRCLYDPKFSLLVTAGFDSAIKVHQLQASLPKAPQEQVAEVKELIDRTEIFTVCIPNSSEHTGLMDRLRSPKNNITIMYTYGVDTLSPVCSSPCWEKTCLDEPGFLFFLKLRKIVDGSWKC